MGGLNSRRGARPAMPRRNPNPGSGSVTAEPHCQRDDARHQHTSLTSLMKTMGSTTGNVASVTIRKIPTAARRCSRTASISVVAIGRTIAGRSAPSMSVRPEPAFGARRTARTCVSSRLRRGDNSTPRPAVGGWTSNLDSAVEPYRDRPMHRIRARKIQNDRSAIAPALPYLRATLRLSPYRCVGHRAHFEFFSPIFGTLVALATGSSAESRMKQFNTF